MTDLATLKPDHSHLWLEPTEEALLVPGPMRHLCKYIRSLPNPGFQDFIEVELEPPLPRLMVNFLERPPHISQSDWEILDQEHTHVILSARYQGVRLLPELSQPRVLVHVFLPRRAIDEIGPANLLLAMWGYATSIE